jgi:predicted DNA-binding transcriptional regulator AlpA
MQEKPEDQSLNIRDEPTPIGDPLGILLAEIRSRGARMLKLRDVMARTTLARNTIHEMEVRGEFPKRRRLVGKGERVGWLESEIEDWIRSRPTEEEARRRG